VITLFDDSWERKVVANQKVLEIHQEIEAWQVDIEKSQRKLANVVKAIQEGNKAESRNETILLEKITLCHREIARLERENVSAQQVLHVAADEFESVKKQFDQLQKLYRVPQVNTATEYLGKTENRRSLDDMTTAVLENLATMSSYDDPNNS
jgi:predicted  nucleic acid-binding Zn-ribbon protein